MNLSERYPREMLPVRVIPVSRSIALIDPEDFDFVSRYHWFLGDNGRPRMSRTLGASGRSLEMHELLMTSIMVDHINRNPLDNRRCNLRDTDKSLNGANRNLPKNSTSRFKGVTWQKNVKKWRAQITVRGNHITLGSFGNVIDAAEAYDQAAVLYFGEHAATNKSLGLLSEYAHGIESEEPGDRYVVDPGWPPQGS